MQAWSQFYAAIAAASAALLGLLYVAVSINAAAALGPDQPVSQRLAEQAFQNYLAVLIWWRCCRCSPTSARSSSAG